MAIFLASSSDITFSLYSDFDFEINSEGIVVFKILYTFPSLSISILNHAPEMGFS